jgi:3-methyladenine DNA glycosylase AlkD
MFDDRSCGAEGSEASSDIVNRIIRDIESESSEKYAEFHRKMIQSEKGYGRGDRVMGCPMPNLRGIVKKYRSRITREDTERLLQSVYHEARTAALLIMTQEFRDGDGELRKNIIGMYMNNLGFINNWDLVDISAHRLPGAYFESDDPIFERLSESENLWENRIAVVATYSFIKRGDFGLTLKLCRKLMGHKHHLIHKACGWMLREVGKKDEKVLADFLRRYSAAMPRIMLSYARERIRKTAPA